MSGAATTIDVMTIVERFQSLHAGGFFVMPNAWDQGSARILEGLGFPAIATTSSGLAAALGRGDHEVRRDEVVEHVRQLTSTVSIPVSVDAETCYPDDDGGIAETVRQLAQAGASGFSIEDHIPGDGLLPINDAAGRVREAVSAAAPYGLVVTARAENALHGLDDIDDIVARLTAYRDAGADVVFAPALTARHDIEAIVNVGPPVSFLRWDGAPGLDELAELGVRRVSTGGSFPQVAYDAFTAAAKKLRSSSSSSPAAPPA